jgi:hypothetical protein
MKSSASLTAYIVAIDPIVAVAKPESMNVLRVNSTIPPMLLKTDTL